MVIRLPYKDDGVRDYREWEFWRGREGGKERKEGGRGGEKGREEGGEREEKNTNHWKNVHDIYPSNFRQKGENISWVKRAVNNCSVN